MNDMIANRSSRLESTMLCVATPRNGSHDRRISGPHRRICGLSMAGLMGLLPLLLSTCASTSDYYVDEERASVLLVRGYLESGALHRWQTCDDGMTGFIDCATGLPSEATFVVEEAILGAPRRKRLRLHFRYAAHWPELALRQQYVAVILSDGSVDELEGVATVAPTVDGRWAIPVRVYDPSGDVLPCTKSEVRPTPLQFASPRPAESLAELQFDERDVSRFRERLIDFKKDDLFSIEADHIYATGGIPLDKLPAAYAGKSATKVAGECP